MKYVCKVYKGRMIDIYKYYWSLEVMSVSFCMCYEWMILFGVLVYMNIL